MLKIRAAQHFFTSVPADQSPNGTRGYQTLFYTKSLGKEMVQFIEDRALYNTGPDEPIKRQCYPLPGNAVAVSQSLALQELDEFGRKGRYLAHTLVVDQTTYAQLGMSPFDLFAQFQFLKSLDGVFQQGDMGSGSVPAISLEIDRMWESQAVHISRAWARNDLEQLGRMAWTASDLVRQRRVVYLLGSEQEQLGTLYLLYLLASPYDRLQLSFDTHALDCAWERKGMFWLIGYSDVAPRNADLVIKSKTHQVQTSLSGEKDEPYAVWMINDAIPHGLEKLGSQQEWAARLNSALTSHTGKHIDIGDIPHAFVERFVSVNASAVTRQWLLLLPGNLSPDLSQYLTSRLQNRSGLNMRILVEGIQPQHIREFMWEALLDLYKIPSKADQKSLTSWIQSTQYPCLAVLPAFWAGDSKRWQTQLQGLSAGDYQFMLEHLKQWPTTPIPFTDALVGPPKGRRRQRKTQNEVYVVDMNKLSIWLNQIAPGLDAQAWQKVLPRFAVMGDEAVDQLAQSLPQLPPQSRDVVQQWLWQYKEDTTQSPSGSSRVGEKASRWQRLFKRGGS